MKRAFVVLTALSLAACGRDRADAFRNGFPLAGDVQMKVPEGSGQALSGTSQRQDGLEGQKADLYVVTRVVTVVVNTGTAAVLGLVKGITNHPPTSLKQDVAVWGPHTDPLSPNTWKFTVTRNKANDYSYVLEGKGKTEPDANYRVVLSGSHVVATDGAGNPKERFGNGTFLIDWNEAQKLPEHDNNVGTAEFTYSRLTLSDPVKLDVAFKQVRDGASAKLLDANYRYEATAGKGGAFEFQVVKNFDVNPAKSAEETASIKSRWLETGAGRSDVKVKGGDLTSEATMSECWDSGFLSRYLNLSFDASKNYGAESVCAFAKAEYSTLTF